MSKTLKFDDGDITIDQNKGRPFFIEGLQKASQDVAYALMTATDQLRGIGCGLKNFETTYRQSSVQGTTTRLAVSQEVYTAIERLMAWQKYEYGVMPDAERIVGIQSLDLVQATITSLLFSLAVQVADSDIFQNAFRIRLGQQFVTDPSKNLPGLVTDDTRPL